MKKAKQLIFVLLIMAVTALALVACGGSDATIALKDDAMPQLVYPLGEELDLSGGTLSLTDKDGTRDLDMTAEGVSVSGYDKDKLGEQTVTISYGKSSVTVTVTVVERMQAVDVVTDYLVGDEFNVKTGKLKVTRNDGSSYTVVLNSEKVTITGFSSDKAGESEVTLSYTSGGETYTTKLAVTVYDASGVTLTKPNKVTYKSHDGAIDLSGGYLTLMGADGKLKRDIPISEGMIEGFDLGAVNEENSPLAQTVTVKFGTYSFDFDIKISYTAVTKFIDNASATADLDFSGDFMTDETLEPVISDEVGTLAVELARLYIEMSPAERTLIPEEEKLSVIRAAMLYALNTWTADTEQFEQAFIYEGGSLMLTCESEEAVADAVEKLRDTDRPLYKMPEVMMGITELFANEIFFYEYLFGDFAVADPASYEGLSELFSYMLELDTMADRIPDNWETEGIENFSDEVIAVFNFIVNGDYASYAFNQIYYGVSMWRTNDDLFDALYSYFYAKEDVSSLIQLGLIRLPSELEEIFSYLSGVLETMNAIAQGGVADTSPLFYYYCKAEQLVDELALSDDIMLKELYLILPLNGMMGVGGDEIFYFDTLFEYVRTAEGGVYASSGALLGDADYNYLMDKYTEILIGIADDEEYEGSAKYASDLEELLQRYIVLSPASQYTFLGTLCPFYGMGMPQYAFEPVMDMEGQSVDLSCAFVTLLVEHYRGLFAAEEAGDAYVDLMVVAEAYAQRYTNTSWLEEMGERIASIDAALLTMSDADRAVFDTKLGTVLADYKSILAEESARPEGRPEPELGEWADEFAALKMAVIETELSYQLLSGGYNYYTLFLTSFERVNTIAENILANAPADVREAFLVLNLYSSDDLTRFVTPDAEIDESQTVYMSYDYIISIYRSVYVNLLLTVYNGESVYDFYVSEGLGEFMDLAYDVVWPFMWAAEGDEDIFDRAKAIAAMQSFHSLSVRAQTIVALVFESEYSIYFMALDLMIEEECTAEGAKVLAAMTELELAHIVYSNLADEESLAELVAALESLEQAYGALSDEEKAAFADFKSGYDTVVSVVRATLAEAESSAE